MYPRNATTPPRIALGAVIQISDGAPQTASVLVSVRKAGGAETAGGGTLVKGTLTDTWYYTPTQAETNGTDFIVTAYKAGCFPVSQTVITSASTVVGTTSVNNIAANAITANSIASSALSIAKFAADIGTTAYASNPLARALGESLTAAMTTAGSFGKRVADNFLQTGDSFARLGAPTGASVSADIATKATVTELAKVPKKDTAQTWANQAGDTQQVTITQA